MLFRSRARGAEIQRYPGIKWHDLASGTDLEVRVTTRRGRPRRENSWEIKQEVLLGLMKGQPLTVITRKAGISVTTANRWADEDGAFAADLAAARAMVAGGAGHQGGGSGG